MRRRAFQLLYLAVMAPFAVFQMWRHWGKPEFWPLVGLSLLLTLIVMKAGKDRHEDLKARLPGARTLF